MGLMKALAYGMIGGSCFMMVMNAMMGFNIQHTGQYAIVGALLAIACATMAGKEDSKKK